MILLLLIIAVTTGIYFLNLNYKYWQKRGVPGPKPRFFFGNMSESFLVKKSPAEVYADIYRNFEKAPLVGIFRGFSPALIIRDPDLIKDITVKSFQQFHDNELILDKDVDPLLGRNPFFTTGDHWKSHRVLLTPGFTSGKMKTIYPLLEEVSRQFVKYIEKESRNGPCHIKNVCMRFTLNNVGSCAFGLDAKCFDEENNEFKQVADRFFSPEGWQNLKVYIIAILPFLSKFVSVKFTPNDVEERLTNIVEQTLKYREENNIVRNDFLEILNQIKKKNSNFTNIDIVAHAAGFFGDGYETSSVVMHFILYELAANPEIQSRLREEITNAFEENNNSLPYKVLQNLPYLDAVFNETLRIYPAVGSLNKMCTTNYTYIPKDNAVIKNPFVIEAQTSVILPVYGLHHDSKYYEEPEKFKPERFFKDNKENITKYTFLPFGEGPRTCLGQKFGSLQIKVGVAYVVKNFKISVNQKTKRPIKFNPTYFFMLPKDPIWLNFKKIA